MANFADLVKANRSQGKGVIGSLGGAIGKTTLEKVDPRNYLFNRSGVLTALFPSLKGYQAKATTEKISSTTTGGGGFSNGQVELISDKLDQISTQNSIVAKNSMVLPMMHRDINVMRQSMVKMVKIWGGNQRDKADRFFMDSKTREAAYESRFSKKPTPVAQPGKEPEKEGFFSKLLGSGIMPLLIKGGMALMVAGAIKTYFNDPEFKKTIDDGVRTIFSTIGALMKEHWDITLGALALLFPKATLTVIGEGLGLLAKILGFSGVEGGLITLLGRFAGVLAGPVGVIALLAAFAVGLSDWLEENTEWGKKSKQNRLDQPKNLKDIPAPADKTQPAKDGESGMTKEQLDAEKRAVKRANELFMNGGMRVRDANGDYTEQYLKVLNTYRKEEGSPLGVSANKQTETNKQGTTGTQPTPVNQSNNSPTPSKGAVLTDDAKKNAESYLGRSISQQEWDYMMKAVYAESSKNKDSYARVMAVILNRARKSNASLIDVLNETNQFQAVTGVPGNRNPSASFVSGPDANASQMINDSTNILSGISKNLDAFTSANPSAYGKGTNIGWLNTLKSAGGQEVAGSVFAENMYKGNTTGGLLNQGSSQLAAGHRGEGNINIQNSGNTVIAGNQGKEQQQQVQLSMAEVMDTDLMKELFRKRAVSYS